MQAAKSAGFRLQQREQLDGDPKSQCAPRQALPKPHHAPAAEKLALTSCTSAKADAPTRCSNPSQPVGASQAAAEHADSTAGATLLHMPTRGGACQADRSASRGKVELSAQFKDASTTPAAGQCDSSSAIEHAVASKTAQTLHQSALAQKYTGSAAAAAPEGLRPHAAPASPAAPHLLAPERPMQRRDAVAAAAPHPASVTSSEVDDGAERGALQELMTEAAVGPGSAGAQGRAASPDVVASARSGVDAGREDVYKHVANNLRAICEPTASAGAPDAKTSTAGATVDSSYEAAAQRTAEVATGRLNADCGEKRGLQAKRKGGQQAEGSKAAKKRKQTFSRVLKRK